MQLKPYLYKACLKRVVRFTQGRFIKQYGSTSIFTRPLQVVALFLDQPGKFPLIGCFIARSSSDLPRVSNSSRGNIAIEFGKGKEEGTNRSTRTSTK